MPEFVAQHDTLPAWLKSANADFLRGYLAAAEWLIHDKADDPEAGIDRDTIRGWSRAALRTACDDCNAFFDANAAALDRYGKLYQPRPGYTVMECAGHDFWLSRNGHGAGFFDRGDDPVFAQLQDAARAYCDRDIYAVRGWLHFE